MAGINFGIAFGNAMSNGIKTYQDLQLMSQQAEQFKQQQDQWAREDQERQAAATPPQSNTTTVTPGSLAQQMQGADGKADPDAVMGTYGAVQDPTQAPSVTKNIVQGGIAQGQIANTQAGQGPQALAYQGPAPAGAPPVAGAPVPKQGIPGGEGNVAAATQYVRGEEGGYVANDNGKGPTKYGINGQANGLTPAQVAALQPDQADRMYRDRYFTGQNGGVDIRNLDQTSAVAVADTAANMGQGTAAKLWEQSGGDLPKFLDLRQKEYDAIKASPDTHAAWNLRMSHLRDFVNQHGTSETGGANGAPPVAPDTKLTELHAAPLSSTVGIGDNVKFTHDGEGNVQMTKGDTAADAAMRMANAAMKNGDFKNGPQLMKVAIDMRAQESQAQVTKIMTDEHMDSDAKVSALAQMAGMKAYKTEQGNYLIPGLGPTDAKGNPMPMTAPQVGALASQLATPDGLQHVIETQIALQKMAQADKELGVKQQQADAATSEAASKATTANADAAYKGKVGEYYGAEKNAIIGEKNAKAAKEAQDAELHKQLDGIQNQVAALDPKDPDYSQKLNHLRAQAQIIGARITGKYDAQKPEKMEDNAAYVDSNGHITRMVPGAGMVPEHDVPRITAGMAEMQKNPDNYKGMVVAGKSGDGTSWGFALTPSIAGPLAGKMFPTPQAAIAAWRAQLKGPGSGGLSTPAPAAVIPAGIPVADNPTAATP